MEEFNLDDYSEYVKEYSNLNSDIIKMVLEFNNKWRENETIQIMGLETSIAIFPENTEEIQNMVKEIYDHFDKKYTN